MNKSISTPISVVFQREEKEDAPRPFINSLTSKRKLPRILSHQNIGIYINSYWHSAPRCVCGMLVRLSWYYGKIGNSLSREGCLRVDRDYFHHCTRYMIRVCFFSRTSVRVLSFSLSCFLGELRKIVQTINKLNYHQHTSP